MIPAAVRIFVYAEAIDMRQGFDRLAQLVKSKLGEDPQAGSLFVFANRNATRLKHVFRNDLLAVELEKTAAIMLADLNEWTVSYRERSLEIPA